MQRGKNAAPGPAVSEGPRDPPGPKLALNGPAAGLQRHRTAGSNELFGTMQIAEPYLRRPL